MATELYNGNCYTGNNMANSVVDIAAMDADKACSISDNGMTEDAMTDSVCAAYTECQPDSADTDRYSCICASRLIYVTSGYCSKEKKSVFKLLSSTM